MKQSALRLLKVKQGYIDIYIMIRACMSLSSSSNYNLRKCTTFSNSNFFPHIPCFFLTVTQATITPTSDLCDGDEMYYLGGRSRFLN
jgi:hypothetical protein